MIVIELVDLLWCLPFLIASIMCFGYWTNMVSEPITAIARMIIQLLMVGFILITLFSYSSPLLLMVVLLFMLFVSNWIAMRPLQAKRYHAVPITVACSITVLSALAVSIFAIVKPQPWYTASVCIPLAGMYFANVMNSLSIAAERLQSEKMQRIESALAKSQAFRGAMLPQINTLVAVGLVALPGMMTGQILAGGSPLLAVRYQIMIMALLFSTSALAVSIYLLLITDYEPPFID